VEERLTHRERSTLLRCTPAYSATFQHDCDLVILVLVSSYPKQVSGCWGSHAQHHVDGRGTRERYWYHDIHSGKFIYVFVFDYSMYYDIMFLVGCFL